MEAEEETIRIVHRMVPPRPLHYYFTLNGVAMTAADQPSVDASETSLDLNSAPAAATDTTPFALRKPGHGLRSLNLLDGSKLQKQKQKQQQQQHQHGLAAGQHGQVPPGAPRAPHAPPGDPPSGAQGRRGAFMRHPTLADIVPMLPPARSAAAGTGGHQEVGAADALHASADALPPETTGGDEAEAKAERVRVGVAQDPASASSSRPGSREHADASAPTAATSPGPRRPSQHAASQSHRQQQLETADITCVRGLPRLASWHQPRPQPEAVPEGPVWSLNTSIFAPRRRESDSRSFWDGPALWARIFDADWAKTKAFRVIKDSKQLDSCTALLRDHCASLNKLFRWYTCVAGAPEADVFNISFNGFNRLTQECDIADQNTCRVKDIDTIFIATNFELGGSNTAEDDANNADNALERFEFLEAVLRLAVAKFLKSGKCVTPRDAVQRLLEEHLEPRAATVPYPDPFRAELYTQAVEHAFLPHLTALQSAFQAGCLLRRGASAQPLMKISEWARLLEDAGFLDQEFSKTDARVVFGLSKTAVVDEMKTDKHTLLSFTDFLEAVARITGYRSLPFPEDEDESMGEGTSATVASGGGGGGSSSSSSGGALGAVQEGEEAADGGSGEGPPSQEYGEEEDNRTLAKKISVLVPMLLQGLATPSTGMRKPTGGISKLKQVTSAVVKLRRSANGTSSATRRRSTSTARPVEAVSTSS